MLTCKKLVITKYLNYSNIDIDLHSKINLFIGKNSAGKTFFLDTIKILTNGELEKIDTAGSVDIKLMFEYKLLTPIKFYSNSIKKNETLYGEFIIKNVIPDEVSDDELGEEILDKKKDKPADFLVSLKISRKNKVVFGLNIKKGNIKGSIGEYHFDENSIFNSLSDIKLNRSFFDSLSAILVRGFGSWVLSNLDKIDIDEQIFDIDMDDEDKISELEFELYSFFLDISPFYYRLSKIGFSNFLSSSLRQMKEDGTSVLDSDCKFRCFIKKSNNTITTFRYPLSKIKGTENLLSSFVNRFIFRNQILNDQFDIDEEKFNSKLISISNPFDLFFNSTRFSGFSFSGISRQVSTSSDSKKMFESLEISYTLRLKSKKKELIPFSTLTPGEERFLVLALSLEESKKNGLFFIDEMENGFHPEWIIKTLELLQDRQSFISTHNPFILDKSFLYVEDNEFEKITNVHIISSNDEIVSIRNLSSEEGKEVASRMEDFGDPSIYLINQGIW